MRKNKFNLLILFFFLLCFSASKGVTQHKQVRNRVSEKQPYQSWIQPSEESQGFVQLRFFDDETDEDEEKEMIRKELELKKEQQQQWCQANKHFKEQQWFSEALEKASRCIKWEDLAQEKGKQQQQFKFFLLEKKKDLKKNDREDRNGDHQYEKLGQKEERDVGKYLKYSVVQKSVKRNESVSRKETTQTKEGENDDDDEDFQEQHEEEEDNQEEIEESEESNENEEEQELEIKSKETGHSADNLKLLNGSKDIKEDQFNSSQLDQGEQDTSTQFNNIQCTQKQNKKYCSQVECIQIEMEDSFVKEDFLKVLSCLNEGMLSCDSFRLDTQHLDILYEYCLRDGSAGFSQKQKYLAHKVHLQVRHCNKLANTNYFRCLAEIQSAEESKLTREGYDCVEKYTMIHDDILPSCQKQFLTSLDTKHEQFQELCDLKCGQLYEQFFAPLILEQPQQKYKELERCIKDIQGNDEGLIKEAINVITCVKDKQLALVDSLKQK